jgi:hypothetical protein
MDRDTTLPATAGVMHAPLRGVYVFHLGRRLLRVCETRETSGTRLPRLVRTPERRAASCQPWPACMSIFICFLARCRGSSSTMRFLASCSACFTCPRLNEQGRVHSLFPSQPFPGWSGQRRFLPRCSRHSPRRSGWPIPS